MSLYGALPKMMEMKRIVLLWFLCLITSIRLCDGFLLPVLQSQCRGDSHLHHVVGEEKATSRVHVVSASSRRRWRPPLQLLLLSSSSTLAAPPVRNNSKKNTTAPMLDETIDDCPRVSGDHCRRPKIVLVAGFESFNRDLYQRAARDLQVDLQVFADSDIRKSLVTTLMISGNSSSFSNNSLPTSSNRDDPDDPDDGAGSSTSWRLLNPVFEAAVRQADACIISLIFDYDDVLALKSLLAQVAGPRLIFESATELLEFNRVGSFSMEPKIDGSVSGPPPAIKAILSKFGSGKEEDKLSGYLKLLKVGPDLLKFLPGEKAGDLRAWLEAYRYWNQGGSANVAGMLRVVLHQVSKFHQTRLEESVVSNTLPQLSNLPELEITPDIGLVHPLRDLSFRHSKSRFISSPAEYLSWRLGDATYALANAQGFSLAPRNAPRVAVLLYRKHVITELRYINDLITQMENDGICPVPIFINGVEAHTIVRDLLTSQHEVAGVKAGRITRDSTYQPSKAVMIDAIVNTIGFPLVGGPAGSMEAGRNVAIAEHLLGDMNVPYIIASPLLLQSIPQWKKNGVLGLQSVVLYSLPELDGAIDTIVLGGLVGDKIALVPERVRKLNKRVKQWIELRQTPPSERRIAISLYGFPPNVGAVGTAALLDVPRSLEALLGRLVKEGYDLGDWGRDPNASGESLVAALSVLCENPVITAGADRMRSAVEAKMARALRGDNAVAATLARPGGGLGGAKVVAKEMTFLELEQCLGKYMAKKVRSVWKENDRGPGVSASGNLVIAGLQLGNVWVFVQPLLGVEGDPMRMLFERDLTPHPQYCAVYEYMKGRREEGGIGAQAVVHLG